MSLSTSSSSSSSVSASSTSPTLGETAYTPVKWGNKTYLVVVEYKNPGGDWTQAELTAAKADQVQKSLNTILGLHRGALPFGPTPLPVITSINSEGLHGTNNFISTHGQAKTEDLWRNFEQLILENCTRAKAEGSIISPSNSSSNRFSPISSASNSSRSTDSDGFVHIARPGNVRVEFRPFTPENNSTLNVSALTPSPTSQRALVAAAQKNRTPLVAGDDTTVKEAREAYITLLQQPPRFQAALYAKILRKIFCPTIPKSNLDSNTPQIENLINTAVHEVYRQVEEFNKTHQDSLNITEWCMYGLNRLKTEDPSLLEKMTREYSEIREAIVAEKNETKRR